MDGEFKERKDVDVMREEVYLTPSLGVRQQAQVCALHHSTENPSGDLLTPLCSAVSVPTLVNEGEREPLHACMHRLSVHHHTREYRDCSCCRRQADVIYLFTVSRRHRGQLPCRMAVCQ